MFNQKASFYWQHYDLKEDPFAPIYDENMTFVLPKWEQHLDLLQHLLHHENVLLAVIGEPGMGTTSFKDLLHAQIKDTTHVVSIDGSASMSPSHLLQIISQGFGLSLDIADTLEEQLDGLITLIQYGKTDCVLLVDEAMSLNKEAMQTLLYLIKQQSEAQKRFHVVLFSDLDLQPRLAAIAKQELSSDLIHTIELEPLTLEETRQYLQHRLMSAGQAGAMPFNELTIEQIYQASRGLPAEINRVAQQYMLEGLNKSEVEIAMPQQYNKNYRARILGGAFIIILIALVVLFLYHGEEFNGSAKSSKQGLAYPNQTQTIELAPKPEQEVAPAAAPVYTPTPAPQANQAMQSQPVADNQPANVAATPVAPAVEPQVAPAEMQKQEMAAEQPAQNVAPQNSVTAPQNSAPATTPAQAPAGVLNDEANELEVAPPVENSAPQQPVDGQPATSPPIAPSAQSTDTQSVSTQTAAMSETAAKAPDESIDPVLSLNNNKNKKSKAANKNNEKSKSKKSLQAQTKSANKNANGKSALSKGKPGHYVLQIMGVSREESARKFINSNHLQGTVSYQRTTLNGKPWFIIVYGDYPSYKAALNDKENMPAELRKHNSWPRKSAG